ncbi:MAG: hypothetical protein BGO32_01530 [Bacteroidetes bacterium 37-13]|nr:MAG: hypothetical protein BGO32_01530 [Bacteroidetes bacterium 37-13]
MKKSILLLVCIGGLFACGDKDKIVKDHALVGIWRMDSLISLTQTLAFYKDTIYWEDSPNKRLLMSVQEDNTFKWEYITMGGQGVGSFVLTKNEYGYNNIKSNACLTSYPLKSYLMLFYFMEVMNNQGDRQNSYSISGNQLSIFYMEESRIAKFTKEE